MPPTALVGLLKLAEVTVTPATSYTASISHGSASVPATETITYTLNGTLATNVTITPDDLGIYGSFSPTTVTIDAGSTVGTTAWTINFHGVSTATSTNNESLTDPAGVTFTASSTTFTEGTITETGHTETTLSFTATNAVADVGMWSGTYQWWRRLHNTGDYVAIGGATTLSPFTDTGLTAATAYDYALIYTQTSNGETGIAFALDVTTDSAIVAGVITNTAATSTTLSFTATEATGGVSPYSHQWAYRLAGMGSYVNFGTNALSEVLSGLSPNTAYDIRLTYTDADSDTAQAFDLDVTTKQGGLGGLPQIVNMPIGLLTTGNAVRMTGLP